MLQAPGVGCAWAPPFTSSLSLREHRLESQDALLEGDQSRRFDSLLRNRKKEHELLADIPSAGVMLSSNSRGGRWRGKSSELRNVVNYVFGECLPFETKGMVFIPAL